MEKILLEKIKQMSGTTLGIGLNKQNLLTAIEKNNKIETCYLLESPLKKTGILGRKKLYFNKKLKKINIKKIKKIFKHKRIENLICNYETISPFLKTFVRDSVYINKGKTYIYGEEEAVEAIINKYKRYTSNIIVEKSRQEFLIIIDNTNTKNKKTKDILYWWKDTFENILDFLTTLLVN